jgi:hypothetical protein
MKNDNDPYDDTRYGHGTGEARDSVSPDQQRQGRAGGCPECRFVPTRVGDSFITDVNEFGKAVVYATDNGAKVVQCALGTINRNALRPGRARLRLQEGRARGGRAWPTRTPATTTCPRPATTRCPVHAIQYDGPSARTRRPSSRSPVLELRRAELPLRLGHRLLQRGHGRALGHRGLVYSAGLKNTTSPRSRPGEAAQIFFTTADDIDVPESREARRASTAGRTGLRSALRLRPRERQPRGRGREGGAHPARGRHHLAPAGSRCSTRTRSGPDRHRGLGLAPRASSTTTWRVGPGRAAARRRVQGLQRDEEHRPSVVVGADGAARVARHPRHRPDPRAGRRQPARRERLHHHRARARDRALRRRHRRRARRAAPHVLRARAIRRW